MYEVTALTHVIPHRQRASEWFSSRAHAATTAAMHNRSPHCVLGGEGESGYKRARILEGERFCKLEEASVVR